MKRMKRFLFIILLLMPVVILGLSFTDYDASINNVNTYINKYSDKDKYLLFNTLYGYNSGSAISDPSFNKGGLLSREEYLLSKGTNTSYLAIGKEYWTLTGNETYQYYIDEDIREKNKGESSGVRVTEYVKPQVKVTGKGTYVNPWEFKDQYNVVFRVNNSTYGSITKVDGYNSSQALVDKDKVIDVEIKASSGYMYKDCSCNLTFKDTVNNTTNKYQTEPVVSDMICVVNFDIRKVIINYDCNGGTGSTASQTVTHGSSYTLRTSGCSKTGYSQTGWKASDGSAYSNEETGTWTYENGSRGISNNTVTLKAVWKDTTNPKLTLTVYNYDNTKTNNVGSTVLKASQDFTSNGTFTVTSNWISSGVTFKFESKDNESGIKDIKWKWNPAGRANDTIDDYSGGNRTFNSEFATIYDYFSADGYRKGQWTITDNTGNAITVTIVAQIDKEVPECSITKTQTNNTNGVSATVGCTDNVSCTSSKSSFTNIKENKTYQIEDPAGNTKTCTVEVTAQLQKDTYNDCKSTTSSCVYGCDTCWVCPSGTVLSNGSCLYEYTSASTCKNACNFQDCTQVGSNYYCPGKTTGKVSSPCNCSNCHSTEETCVGGWNGSWQNVTSCTAATNSVRCRTIYK